MAGPLRPNANWEPGGTIPITEGTPANSIAYSTFVFPNYTTGTAAANTGWPQQQYVIHTQETPYADLLQRQLEQQGQARELHDEYMRQMQQLYMYGNATFRTSWEPAEPEKPLATKELSALDRLRLQEALPW